MAFQILVSNMAGEKGAIVGIYSQDHKWSAKESLDSWMLHNSEVDISNYHRNFSIIICNDEDLIDNLYLLDSVDGRIEQKYYFVEPEKDSDEWFQLYSTGKITAKKSIVELFIRERN